MVKKPRESMDSDSADAVPPGYFSSGSSTRKKSPGATGPWPVPTPTKKPMTDAQKRQTSGGEGRNVTVSKNKGGSVKKKYADGGNIVSGNPRPAFNPSPYPQPPGAFLGQPPQMGGGMGGGLGGMAARQGGFGGGAGPQVMPQVMPQQQLPAPGMKKGGAVKKFAKGGMVACRGNGIAQRGKSKGRMV